MPARSARHVPIPEIIGTQASSSVRKLLAFQKLARFEDAMLRLPLAEQRAALKSSGGLLRPDTSGGASPRHRFRRALR